LVRVTRPGREIAMGNWTPRGFIGQMFKLMATHVPPPSGMPSPILWGDEARVRERLRDGLAELRITPLVAVLHYPTSVPETVEFYKRYFGPAESAFHKLPPEKKAVLRGELEELWNRHNTASDGSTRVEAEYLEVVGVRA
ncbi:MAG: rebM 2, partial [Ramlibacter sp.]|nr:rebM 2 [Ramlibacter sp.]